MTVLATDYNRFDLYYARDVAEFLTDLAAQMATAGIDPERIKVVITAAADRFHLEVAP